MSNQIVITSGAKVRNLNGVLTGTAGVVNSVPLGGANGVATLDSAGKVPLSQLPASVVTYLGTWNAATNTPTLTNGVGDVGDLYICNVAGTVNFGSGPITFAVGDWVIYSGTTWQKSSGASGTVTSVAMTVPTGLSVTGSPITTSGTLAVSLASGYTIPTTSFLSGLVPYTGATTNVNLGTNSITADYFQASLTPSSTATAAGKMVWDSTYNTLAIGLNSNVAGLSGLSTFYYIKATSVITKGQVIMFTGSVGASGVVTGAPATGVTDGSYIMGIAAEDIALNGFGYVQATGPLKGFDTSMFTDGQILWYNPSVPGGLTATQPTAPNIKVQMAAVIKAGAGGSGSVQVRVSSGSVLGGTDSNVQFGTLTNGDIIKYNGTYWTNVAGTTTNITEGTNLYYTDARARGAISLTTTGTSGAATYNSTTGVLNVPDYGSALSDYVTLATTQTISGTKTFSSAFGTNFTSLIYANGNLRIPSAGTASQTTFQNISSVGIVSSGANLLGFNSNDNFYLAANGKGYAEFSYNNSGSGRTYTLPNVSGTLALTSDIPSLANYVTLNSAQTITGSKTFNSFPYFNNGIYISDASSATTITDYTGLYMTQVGTARTLNLGFDTAYLSKLVFSDTNTFTYTFPTTSGTLALTSDLSAYLPLTGGSLSGALSVGTNLTVGNVLFGNSAQFSNAVTASAYFLNGMTAGSGALYWTSNVVTLANNNASGSLNFKVNNGTTALTLASTGAATFSSTITAAGGSNITGANGSAYLNISNTGNSSIFQFENNISGNNIYSNANVPLQFWTNGAVRLTLSNTGNVGIGTTSPSSITGAINLITRGILGSELCYVQAASYDGLASIGLYSGVNSTDNPSVIFQNSLRFATATSLGTGGYTERMRITSSGNVGIGTSSPSANLQVSSSTNSVIYAVGANNTYRAEMQVEGAGQFTGSLVAVPSASSTYQGIPTSCIGLTTSSTALVFATSATERMRITSGGALCVGTTNNFLSGLVAISGNSGTYNLLALRDTISSVGSDNWYAYFVNDSNVRAGGIQHISSTSVLFVTTSDYRLKENARPIENALNRILALKPVKYNWKEDGTESEGFYAHELQEQIPFAVSGKKDAVDKDGNVNPQGVDYSKVVPVLVKAIQELKAEIDELKNK